ncbi:MAG TPA: hypothetical protein DER02_09095, partial [Gammaproteobacteria bacterium]|nr:hypothetical protein [Gammaproteobacteria bacterium]
MEQVHPVSEAVAQRSFINNAQYQAMYAASIEQPEVFWADQAKHLLTWQQPWTTVMEADMAG